MYFAKTGAKTKKLNVLAARLAGETVPPHGVLHTGIWHNVDEHRGGAFTCTNAYDNDYTSTKFTKTLKVDLNLKS